MTNTNSLTNADIAQIMPAVAAELGPEWDVLTHEHEHGSGATHLLGPVIDGHRLVLAAHTAGQRAGEAGKIAIGVNTNAITEDLPYRVHIAIPSSIKVSAARTAHAIAGEITRRALPSASDYHRRVVEIANRHHDAVAAEAALEGRLRDVMGPHATWDAGTNDYRGARRHAPVGSIRTSPLALPLRIEHRSSDMCELEVSGLEGDELVVLMRAVRSIVDARTSGC